jgi:hypothetical protein
MHLQHGLFKGHDPANDKARCERAEAILQVEIDLQVITNKRRATRRLERALGVCVASGAVKQCDAVAILVGVHHGF